MGRRIGKPQTPTKAGYSDVFDIRQHQKYVKDNILANPKDDALGGVRFDGTSSYLTRTPSNAGNQKTWTWSGWVKPQDFTDGSIDCIWSQQGGTATSQRTALYNNSSDASLIFTQYTGTANDLHYISTQVFRDFNSWYHIVIAADTTLAVAGDRIKIYVNGVLITDFSTETDPSQNLDTYVNNGTYAIEIGQDVKVASRYYSGYLAQIYLVDGLALDPTYFGYTDRETGQWKPKRYTGNFGTNGFYLPMETAPAIDESGNDNHFTAHNITYNDNPLNDSDFIPVTTVVKLTSSETPFTDYVENLSSGTTEASIEFWIKMDGSYNGISGLFNFIFPATDLHLDYYNNTGQGFRLVEGSGTGIPFNYFYKTNVSTTTSLLYDGNWHHVCFTFESLSGLNTSGTPNVQGYLDGTLMTGTAATGGGNYTNKNFPAIGRGNGYTDTDITEIRKFRIYPKHLSSSQVTTLYNQTESIAHSSFNLRTETYSSNSHDVVPDSPQNTFATLNPLVGSTSTLSDGNLKSVVGNASTKTLSTISFKSGKYFCEVVFTSLTGDGSIGITKLPAGIGSHVGYDSESYGYVAVSGGKRNNSGTTSYGNSWGVNDVIGIYFDDGDLYFTKNGVLQNSGKPAFSLGTTNTYAFAFGDNAGAASSTLIANFGQDHTFIGTKSALATPYTDANGIGEFYYPPPDGALALCTKNIEGGLGNATIIKKYYNRDETGKVLSYGGYNDYTYGTINDERFSDLSPYASGKSLINNNTDSKRVILSDSDDWNLSNDSFTVEAWLYQTATPASRGEFLRQWETGVKNFIFYINSSNQLAWYYSTTGSNETLLTYTGGTITNNRWNHVAFVRDASSDTVTAYINGTSVGSTTSFTATLPNSTDPLYTGYSSVFFTGYIADLRLVKGIAVYTGNFTPPTAPLTTTQSSGTNIAAITGSETKLLLQPYNTETVNNTPPMYTRDETGLISFSYGSGLSFANISPYEDNSVKSFRFKDGTSSDIGLKPENYTPNFDANDFTMEWWFKPNTITGSYVGMHWAGNSVANQDELHVAFQSSKIHLYLNSSWVDTSYTPKLNEWQHLAIVRDYGTSLKMYINGVEQYSTTTNASISNNYDGYGESTTYTEQVRFGMHNGYGFYDGLMCDIRMTSGVAIYTSDFTPPAYKLRSDFYTTDGTDPASSGTRSAFSSGQVRLLAQPYSQPAQIHDVGSTYRTNRTYLTDETGKNLIYG